MYIFIWITSVYLKLGFPGGSVVKNPPANAGDEGSIPGSGRCPAEGANNPLQYSSLDKSMERGTWQATVHSIAKSRTRLKRLSVHIHEGRSRDAGNLTALVLGRQKWEIRVCQGLTVQIKAKTTGETEWCLGISGLWEESLMELLNLIGYIYILFQNGLKTRRPIIL